MPPPTPKVTVALPLQKAVTPYLDATGNTVAYNQVDLVARVAVSFRTFATRTAPSRIVATRCS